MSSESLGLAAKQFLRYLQQHPEVRAQIRAKPNQTVLYSGYMFRRAKDELIELIKEHPQFHGKEMLPDVIARIRTTDTHYATLLEYAEALEKPWFPDGYTVWRALSGIFASNAEGQVSFYIGKNVSIENKNVFAVTEIPVLIRNPKLDTLTKDLLAYYQRCVRIGPHATNFSFIGGIGEAQ